MGTEVSTDQDQSAVSCEDEEIKDHPDSDVIDQEFSDRGSSFDIEERLRPLG
jgi:hypothetical protein